MSWQRMVSSGIQAVISCRGGDSRNFVSRMAMAKAAESDLGAMLQRSGNPGVRWIRAAK